MADSFTIRFPPIDYRTINSGSFTMEPGVVPSAGVIECTEQTITQQTADLKLTWTSPETGTKTITLPDCKIESIAQVKVGVIAVTVLDRRWKWRYGHLDGLYNLQTGDDTWDYEKTPKELIEICLDAMGEQGYDTQVVNSEEKLFVDWKGDVPAFALAELCDLLGYEVTITPQNKVKICKAGEGGPLPTVGSLGAQVLQSATGSIDDGHLPEKIRIATAPIRYEVMFELEAVGLEADGDIKELSTVDWFAGLTAAQKVSYNSPRWGILTDDEERGLAQQTAFRWYRIKDMVDGEGASGFNPPGFLGETGDITSVYQMLPLLPHRNVQETPVGGTWETDKPHYVEGVFYMHADKEAGGNSNGGTRYPFGSTIDAQRGIVRFGQPVGQVVNNSGTYEWQPAELYLVCCIEVRDPENFQQQYYGWTWNAGGLPGAGILTIDRSELIPKVTSSYSNGTLVATEDNLATIKAEAEKFAQATLRKLKPLARSGQQFAGFHPVALDGLIQQVSWSWGPGGPVTQVAAGGPWQGAGGFKPKQRAVIRQRKQRVSERREKAMFPYRNFNKHAEASQ